MGQTIKGPAELLEGCFSKPEWEFLKHHKDFKVELKKGCKTLDDFERLSILGARIIQETETLPDKPTTPRVRPGNRKQS